MGIHMKTTVEISDALLAKAKAVAAREGTTVRALIERALREVVESYRDKGNYKLRAAAFRGKGLQPGVPEGEWEVVRDLAYDRRGA